MTLTVFVFWTMKLFPSALSAVLLTVGGFATIASAEVFPTTTVRAKQAQTSAELSYQKTTDSFPKFTNVKLKIVRNGKTLLNHMPKVSEYDRPVSEYQAGKGFLVRDLDGDGEPEVIANFHTGGAHCCEYSLMYRYEAAKNTYSSIEHPWRDVGFVLEDLNKDGKIELRSVDTRFGYAFASFAGSGFPLQVWRYSKGKMIDVTRSFPEDVYADAYRYWQRYNEAKKTDSEVKGLLAAYLADKYLLNQQEDGWKQVKAAYQKSDRAAFFSDLATFLKKTGYAK